MSASIIHPLVDGPLSADPVTARASLVAKMAAELIKHDAFRDPSDAFYTLFGTFSSFEIGRCLDDARQVAMQHVVAMEMADV